MWMASLGQHEVNLALSSPSSLSPINSHLSSITMTLPTTSRAPPSHNHYMLQPPSSLPQMMW